MQRNSKLLFEHSPHLEEQWDYSKNVGVDPTRLTYGLGLKVWWLCAEGHSFQQTLNRRTSRSGRECSICNGKKILEGFNDLRTTHPEVCSELDDPAPATQLSKGSRLKVYWKCTLGHRYLMMVSNKVKGRGCPICANKQIEVGFNDLETTHPLLASQLLDPSVARSVTYGTPKKLEWVCGLGHSWSAALNSRVSGRNCPYCANKKALKGYNDLATVRPDIAAELRDPDLAAALTFGSKKLVEWVCKKGHVWRTAVHLRCAGSGCPMCCEVGTSLIEKRIRRLINESEFENSSPEGPCKLEISFGSRRNQNVDFLVKTKGQLFAIEYDGKYYHSSDDAVSRDKRKTLSLLEAGYHVARIRENDLHLLDIQDDRLLQVNVPFSYSDTLIEKALCDIFDWIRAKDSS